MALIGCPECKKKVSESAANCPNCGFLLSPEMVEAIKKKEQAAQSKTAIGCLAIIIIIFVFYIIGKISSPIASSGSGSKAPRMVVENSAWDGSVHQVKTWLKANAKDPDSLDFIEWSTVKRMEDGGFMVRVKYRGKNSFGGYSLENKVFFLDSTGSVVNVIDFTK